MAPNGTSHRAILAAKPGVFIPLLTFFKPQTEEVDIETTVKHAIESAKAGLGLVALGSMGEADLLTHSERNEIIKALRIALDSNGLSSTPLIAGAGTGSTKETIELCVEAKQAGADQVMVIPPGYYAGALDKKALKDFFLDVAKASPLPVFVYNFPGAAAGIDMDSDLIAEIASSSENICGCKLTCGSVGKLTRLTQIPNFHVLGGFSDFLLSGMFMKSSGCITGLANVTPKSIVKLYSLISTAVESGNPVDLQKAQNLQFLVSKSDWIMVKAGITGTKALLEELKGYGGLPRKPLPAYSGNVQELKESLKELLELEASL